MFLLSVLLLVTLDVRMVAAHTVVEVLPFGGRCICARFGVDRLGKSLFMLWEFVWVLVFCVAAWARLVA